MRMLAITPENQAKVDAVVAYAIDHPQFIRNNKFISGPPGDNPAHVVVLDTFRCVFSFTWTGGKCFRDLSISIPVLGKFPNTYAAFFIAKMFGFTGWDEKSPDAPEGWFATPMPRDNCIRLVQETNTPFAYNTFTGVRKDFPKADDEDETKDN